jgi:outer membrane protein with beta-barrel domain
MKLVLALSLALALPACAAMHPQQQGGEEWYPNSPTGVKEYGRKGGYGSAGVIQSFENFDTAGTGLSASDSDVGFALRAGARLEKNVAIELSAESLTGFGLRGAGGSVDLDMWSVGVQGKYFFSDQKIQPYGLFGFGVANAQVDDLSIDDDGTYIRLGGGADFYVNKDVAIFGEVSYNRMLGDLKDLDHVDFIVGVMVRF